MTSPGDENSTATATDERRRGRRLKKFGFALLLAFVLIALVEGGLHLACALSPRLADSLSSNRRTSSTAASLIPTVPDDRLQYRPNPAYSEHDTNGFRNASVPAQADVVALGDSQTYGVGVARDEAWPQRVASQSDCVTYNMAFGGYGPTHSAVLFDEAVSLQPKVVIATIYAGNDLWDCYHMVHARRQLPELKSNDPAIDKAIAEAEAAEPLHARIEKMARVLEGDFEAINGELPPEKNEEFWQQVNSLRQTSSSVPVFIRQNSKLYALTREFGDRLFPAPKETSEEWKILKLRAGISGGLWDVYETKTVGAILVPRYRLCGLDLADARIGEGHHIALEAMRAMDAKSRDGNVHFAVLLIPTKELVFAEASKSTNETTDLTKLAQNERQMWRQTKQFLDGANIQHIDSLPMLVACVRDGHQPYPRNPDGHPNEVGQEAIARCVADFLEGTGWLAESESAAER